jgi:hypothetical protein
VPVMTGRPLQISGEIEIRFSVILHLVISSCERAQSPDHFQP